MTSEPFRITTRPERSQASLSLLTNKAGAKECYRTEIGLSRMQGNLLSRHATWALFEYPKGGFLMAHHRTYFISSFNSTLPSGSRGMGLGLLLCVALLGFLEYWIWCLASGNVFLICIWWQEKEAFNLWSLWCKDNRGLPKIGQKRSYVPTTRLEIYRDRHDRWSCKIFSSCVNFPENNVFPCKKYE